MSKEKQIEEMAEDLKGRDSCKHLPKDLCNQRNCSLCEAEILYEAGYRKQREVEWISNELGWYQYAFYCSECGWVDGYPFNDRHKYCPNCGAKMKRSGR